MSLFQSYRNLSPKARLGVGLGLLAWGFLGLNYGDEIGEKLFGLKPTEQDKAELERLKPKIHVMPREK